MAASIKCWPNPLETTGWCSIYWSKIATSVSKFKPSRNLTKNFSYFFRINANAWNILVICKRTFPREKTCITDMLCYLIYVKNMKIHFIILYVPNSKFKLHRTSKFCQMYKLQYMHYFFQAKIGLTKEIPYTDAFFDQRGT